MTPPASFRRVAQGPLNPYVDVFSHSAAVTVLLHHTDPTASVLVTVTVRLQPRCELLHL